MMKKTLFFTVLFYCISCYATNNSFDGRLISADETHNRLQNAAIITDIILNESAQVNSSERFLYTMMTPDFAGGFRGYDHKFLEFDVDQCTKKIMYHGYYYNQRATAQDLLPGSVMASMGCDLRYYNGVSEYIIVRVVIDILAIIILSEE